VSELSAHESETGLNLAAPPAEQGEDTTTQV
jgi:hypothetical protein